MKFSYPLCFVLVLLQVNSNILLVLIFDFCFHTQKVTPKNKPNFIPVECPDTQCNIAATVFSLDLATRLQHYTRITYDGRRWGKIVSTRRELLQAISQKQNARNNFRGDAIYPFCAIMNELLHRVSGSLENLRVAEIALVPNLTGHFNTPRSQLTLSELVWSDYGKVNQYGQD